MACAANIAFGLGALGPATGAGRRRSGRTSPTTAPGWSATASTAARCTSRRPAHTARFVCTTDATRPDRVVLRGRDGEARDIELGPVAAPVGGLDLVVIGPNDPEAMLRHTAGVPRARRSPFVADPSQQLAWSDGRDDPRGSSTAPTCLFSNEYEAALIEQKTGWTAAEVLGRVGHPRRHPGSRRASASSARVTTPIEVPAVPGVTAVEPTGVGDAFRSGFLGARVAGGCRSSAPRRSAASSPRTSCERVGTQEYAFTTAEFLARLTGAYGDEAARDAARLVRPRASRLTQPHVAETAYRPRATTPNR